MATITCRALDANGEPIWGQSQANFLSDLEAVAQIIATRLKLLQGEWWENLNEGTPLFQSMLGVGGSGRQSGTIELLLTQRISSTPYVTSVSDVSSSYDPETRDFQFACIVDTQFGTITVTNQLPPAAVVALS